MVSCKICKFTKSNKNNNTDMKITLHKCPKNMEVKKLWMQFIQQELGKEIQDQVNIFVCSQHFEERCFDRSSPNKIQLHKNSVPSVSCSYYNRINHTYMSPEDQVDIAEPNNVLTRFEINSTNSANTGHDLENEMVNEIFALTEKINNVTEKTCQMILLKKQMKKLKKQNRIQKDLIKILKQKNRRYRTNLMKL